MTDLTVLIASYETHAMLLACLESVERARRALSDFTMEIVVVDNGSRDGSAAAVQLQHPQVRVLSLVRNRGFAAAVNLGLRLHRGRHVLLLNSDAEVDADLLAGGVAILDDHPAVGVVGPSLVHSDGRPQRSVHALPGLQTEFLPTFLLKLVRPDGFVSRSSPSIEDGERSFRAVEAVRGAVFFFRGTLLEEIGPFDERFFFFLEETEFCARVRRAGFQVVHAPSLRALHRLGASSKTRAPLATRIEFHRSLYRFLGMVRGRGVARAAIGVRTLRGILLILGMSAVYPFSGDIRRRMPERWGLLLWHLRGCPDEPRMDEVLDATAVATCESYREHRATTKDRVRTDGQRQPG